MVHLGRQDDSQWAQALIPLENPAEHGADRTSLAHQMATLYRSEYEDLFGSLPDLADSHVFPRMRRQSTTLRCVPLGTL